MTDESFLQETNKEIWRHSYTSLHECLNLHDSQFYGRKSCSLASRGVLHYGSDGGVWEISPHPLPCCIKLLPKVCIMHCFERTLKNVLPHDTLSHSSRRIILSEKDTLSHNFYLKRTPC